MEQRRRQSDLFWLHVFQPRVPTNELCRYQASPKSLKNRKFIQNNLSDTRVQHAACVCEQREGEKHTGVLKVSCLGTMFLVQMGKVCLWFLFAKKMKVGTVHLVDCTEDTLEWPKNTPSVMWKRNSGPEARVHCTYPQKQTKTVEMTRHMRPPPATMNIRVRSPDSPMLFSFTMLWDTCPTFVSVSFFLAAPLPGDKYISKWNRWSRISNYRNLNSRLIQSPMEITYTYPMLICLCLFAELNDFHLALFFELCGRHLHPQWQRNSQGKTESTQIVETRRKPWSEFGRTSDACAPEGACQWREWPSGGSKRCLTSLML